jgi:hypothetical protein
MVEDTMDRIYRGFVWSQEQRDLRTTGAEGAKSWSADESFLRCSLWLYGWSKPSEIVLGGIFPERTRIVGSAYFLVQEGLVAGAGTITRPK